MVILQLMNVLTAMELVTTVFINQQIARVASTTHFFLILIAIMTVQQDTMVMYRLEIVKLVFYLV
jgi:hypothetical protein